MNIKTIAFDADDTLWVNEPYFRKAEDQFCALMEEYLPQHSSHKELFATEIKNLPLYGYGIKAFTLSMIETAMSISNNTIGLSVIEKLMEIGREMLTAPVELIEDIEKVLQQLHGKAILMLSKFSFLAIKGTVSSQKELSVIKLYFINSDKKDILLLNNILIATKG